MKDSPMTVWKERFGCEKLERKILLKQVGKKDSSKTGWKERFSFDRMGWEVLQ
jgi:hypothetical protein